MKNILSLISMSLLLALAAPVTAQEEDAASSTMTTRAQIDSQLADLKDRLNLTDYQWTQVEMILKSSIRERVAIAQRYGLDGSGEAYANLERKDKRAIRKQMKESRKFTEQRMKRYLDKEQMKEFKNVQEEIHDQVLERLES